MNVLSVSLPLDSDGFLSQECPTCLRRFKVVFTEGSGRTLSFCPYCRHNETGCWWTQEQAAYMGFFLRREFIEPKLDEIIRELESPWCKLRVKKVDEETPTIPIEPEVEMPVAHFGCCDERIKHDGSASTLHCALCGTETGIL